MASNKILTSDVITREGLRILHEQLNFLTNVTTGYDASFSGTGAKIGNAIRIRKPAQYTVRKGATLAVQDHVEEETLLTLNIRRGVDIEFSSEELTLDLDDFSERVLKPAMSKLAASIQSELLEKAVLGTGSTVLRSGGAVAYKDFLKAQALLDNQNASRENRVAIVEPMTNAEIVDALKGLFQDSTEVAKQYREGIIGKTAGAIWYQNNSLPSLTLPTDVAGTIDALGTARADGFYDTIDLAGFGNVETIAAGTAFTVAGVNAVQPETKKDLGYAYTFIVQEDAKTSAAGAVTVKVLPFKFVSGDAQNNVTALPAGTAVVTLVGASAATYAQNLVYSKDAYVFGSADLVLPGGVDAASRANFEGLSLRMVRAYDNSTDVFATRFDILCGFATVRPELAAKVLA